MPKEQITSLSPNIHARRLEAYEKNKEALVEGLLEQERRLEAQLKDAKDGDRTMIENKLLRTRINLDKTLGFQPADEPEIPEEELPPTQTNNKPYTEKKRLRDEEEGYKVFQRYEKLREKYSKYRPKEEDKGAAPQKKQKKNSDIVIKERPKGEIEGKEFQLSKNTPVMLESQPITLETPVEIKVTKETKRSYRFRTQTEIKDETGDWPRGTNGFIDKDDLLAGNGYSESLLGKE